MPLDRKSQDFLSGEQTAEGARRSPLHLSFISGAAGSRWWEGLLPVPPCRQSYGSWAATDLRRAPHKALTGLQVQGQSRTPSQSAVGAEGPGLGDGQLSGTPVLLPPSLPPSIRLREGISKRVNCMTKRPFYSIL